jgi:dephospho-CoA kinase
MHSDPSLKAALIEAFGEKTFLNNTLNRSYLAEIIMNDEAAKDKISNLVHPRVRKSFEAFALRNKEKEIVFNEAAILFETGSYKNFDSIILVTAPEDVRIERVQQRDNASVEQVRERMKNQWSDDQKIPLADYLIENTDATPVLEQVESLLKELNQSTSS